MGETAQLEKITIMPVGKDHLVTEPFARYLKECHDIIDFAGMTWGTALAFDKLAMEKIIRPIPEISDVDEDTFLAALENSANDISDYTKSGKLAWFRLNEHRQLQCQMLHCRVIDNFLSYISETIAAVYHKQPNLLKTQEMVTVEFVLQYGTTEELIAALAEKRVHDLAYKSMRELAKTLSKGWGIKLFHDEEVLSNVVYSVEVRNIIVHNRAIVNQVFLTRIQSLNLFDDFPIKKGELFLLDVDGVVRTLQFLLGCATRIDGLVAAKFALATQLAPEPKQPFKFSHDEPLNAG